MPAAFSGTIPADILPDVSQLFGSLLEARWRDVSFPTVDFEVEIRQDLAIHKLVDRDGAFVEGTGRAPLEFTFRIPFLNGLDAGPNEHWQRPLYPYTWRKFFEACADKTTGVLQHPELGNITCKCEFARTRWEGNVRSGVYVNASFLETDDAGDQIVQSLADQSPVAGVSAFANDLDNYILQAVNADGVPQPFVPTTSFAQLAQAVRAVTDQFSLEQQRLGGQLDNIISNCNAVASSVTNALEWPILNTIQSLKAACFAAKQKGLLQQNKQILLYTTVADMTLAQLSAVIPADPSDLMSLNVPLLSTPLVPAGTVVKFYALPQAA